MSSLIFYTDETQALIATDTLAVSNDVNYIPWKFTTKAIFLPHLRLVIAITGLGNMLNRWSAVVNGELRVASIDQLDVVASTILADIWKEYAALNVDKNFSVTVYHFGFSKKTESIVSYAYRSENNFQSEQLPYGLAVKPECKVPEPYTLPNDFKRLMTLQQEHQAALPQSERVYIGGEIVVYHLTQKGCWIETIDRFDDFDATEQAIYAKFS